MEPSTEVWGLVCDFCRARITEVAYVTWTHRVYPVSLDFNKGIAVLEVPNEFHLQTLTRCYTPLLQEAFNEIFGEGIQIQLCTPEQLVQNKKPDAVPLSKGDYEYTFDIFIVGSSNKFVHTVSMVVAMKPVVLYNPLFTYENPGPGKTYFLYAICNEVSENYPQMNIIYIKEDEFINELIEAIRRGTTVEFHQRYRKADILFVDDTQFIVGKDSTQEEFFHTLNTLYEAKKQIVLTPDRPPKDIATLEERLLTRFEWGLTADVQPPDFETRIAIIKRKAELFEIDLPNDVVEYIANRLKSNIRQLEDAVEKMEAHCLLAGETLSTLTAQAAISDIINNHQPAPMTIEKIIEEVARTFGTSPEDIRSSKCSVDISSAQQIAMYVVRGTIQLSMAPTGEAFGGRDHPTVVHAIQQVEKNIGRDPKTHDAIQDIIRNIHDRQQCDYSLHYYKQYNLKSGEHLHFSANQGKTRFLSVKSFKLPFNIPHRVFNSLLKLKKSLSTPNKYSTMDSGK